jgi:hypothetical protein
MQEDIEGISAPPHELSEGIGDNTEATTAFFHYTENEKNQLIEFIQSILNLPEGACQVIFQDIIDELSLPTSSFSKGGEIPEYRFHGLHVAIRKHCAEKLGHPNPETITGGLENAEQKQVHFTAHIELSRDEISELIDTKGQHYTLEEIIPQFGSVFEQHFGFANPKLIQMAAQKMLLRLSKERTSSGTAQSAIADIVYKSYLDVLEEKVHLPHPDEGRAFKVPIKRIFEASLGRQERDILMNKMFDSVQGTSLYCSEMASEELGMMMYAKAFWLVREQHIHHNKIVFPAVGKPHERYSLSLKAFERCRLSKPQRLAMIGRHLQGKTASKLKAEGDYVKDAYMVARRKIVDQINVVKSIA